MKAIARIAAFLLLTALLAGPAPCPARPAGSPLTQARDLLSRGYYSEGADLLKKIAQASRVDEAGRQEAQLILARLYLEKACAPDDAGLLLERLVRETAADPDGQAGKEARELVSRLQESQGRFSAEDQLLAKARADLARPSSPDRKALAETLAATAENSPDYYRRAEAFFVLGSIYLEQESYKEARAAFKRAQGLAPALNLTLPVDSLALRAKEEQRSFVLNSIVRAGLIALLALCAIVFFTARPWQWMTWAQPAALAGLALFFGILFIASQALLTSFADPLAILAGDPNAMPSFVVTGFWGPGSGPARSLFAYGLAGLFGLFFFAAGVGRMKNRANARLFIYLFAWLWFGFLAGAFYVRDCRSESFNESPRSKNTFDLAKTTFFFDLDEPEPYILTDPQSYAGIDTNAVSDPELLSWVKKNVPEQKAEKANP